MGSDDVSLLSLFTATLGRQEIMRTRTLLESPRTMGRKKSEQRTVMIRTTEGFAEMVKKAAGERGLTIAEFCDKFLTPCADRAHRDYIKAEAKRLSGGEE
jgi:hypothetical protein